MWSAERLATPPSLAAPPTLLLMKTNTNRKPRSNSNSLHIKLRVELARRQMTQRDLAKEIGVAPTTLSGWVTGSHSCPSDLPSVLAKALGTDPAALAP